MENNNNGLDPENEKLLQELEGIFRKKREKEFISQIVNKKIASTDFENMGSVSEIQSSKKSFALWIIAFLILAAGAIWVVLSLKNSNNQEIAKSKQIEAPKPERQTQPEQPVIEESVPDMVQENSIKTASSKERVDKTTIDSSFVVSTKINIKPGSDYNVLSKDLMDILVDQGLKTKNVTKSGKLLYVESPDNIAPSRVDGKFVKYSVIFEIDAANADILKLSLIYEETVRTNFMAKGSTMEEKFYDKLVPALKDYFQKKVNS